MASDAMVWVLGALLASADGAGERACALTPAHTQQHAQVTTRAAREHQRVMPLECKETGASVCVLNGATLTLHGHTDHLASGRVRSRTQF